MSQNKWHLTMNSGEKAIKMEAEYERCRELTDDMLNSYFGGEYLYKRLLESMRYSLLAGGKRVRAIICMKFCEAAGGEMEKALNAACAVEMLHAYSLIHDDLPCMDDDDMRRGRPSNHIEYGEFTATLAGDALQAAAFQTLLDSDAAPEALAQMGRVLAEAAGPHGICGGQYLDISSEGKRLDASRLEGINKLKTSALISASAQIGVIVAGGSGKQLKAAQDYANAVGLAFQIRDDVLDITAQSCTLGKPAGSDKKSGKNTFAALFGIDECEKMIQRETEKAISSIKGQFAHTEFLTWLAGMLAHREK